MNELFEVARIILNQKLDNNNKPSEKELLFLEDWLNQSEKNKALYAKLQKKSAEELLEREPLALNQDSAWQRLNAYAKGGTAMKPRKYHWVKWAAALFIPLSIGLVLFSLLKPHTEESISPGNSGALLTLSNGERVNLEELKDITSLEGGVLSKESDKLVYIEGEKSGRKEKIYNTIETTIGKEFGLKLSDGTEVYLNPLSKVTFPIGFDQNERVVELSGLAYFKVSHDASRPFYVMVDGMKVQVLGTSFSVRSYEDEGFAETVLVEGKVKIVDERGVEQALLTPDHKVVLDKSEGSFDVSEVDARRATSWVEGYYFFEDATLEDILNDLSRWYEFEIEYDRPELKEQRFEGYINKYEELDPVLKIIEHTNSIKIEKNGRTLIVK
ncbi:FecR family protein [Echinicola sp. 20G]|uniref:FecR family protein n=1 Tax=Echinicola sp. 20G TaxID=2781961 RepID=UPI00191116EE|nr:FecR domain-containing protein [Echinicola sp. 20G]